jgi:diguanylate cyclase (GGDEF)-like protein
MAAGDTAQNRTFSERRAQLQRGLVGCCLLYAVVLAFLLLFKRGDLRFIEAFFITLQIAPPIFAGACSLTYAGGQLSSSSALRLAWRLIGAGGIAFGLGLLVRLYYHYVRAGMAPLPSAADLGCLVVYPCLIFAAILLFSNARLPGRARLFIDSALAAGSIGILTWYFFGQRFWFAKVSWPGRMAGVAYALGDAILLAAAFLLIRGAASRKSLSRSWGLLAGGMVMLAFADILFIAGKLGVMHHGANGAGWLWALGWLLIACAALLQTWWPQLNEMQEATGPETARQENAGRWFVSVLAPYLAIAAAFIVVIGHDYGADHAINNPLFLVGLGLILLVIAGEVSNLLETQRWAAQLRSFNANLEEMVARRTGQLGALHQLTKAINNTLKVDQVVAAAASQTAQALQTDVVILWLKDRLPDAQPRLQIFPDRALEGQIETLDFLATLHIRDQVETLALHSVTVSTPDLTPDLPEADSAADNYQYGAYCLRAPLLWQGRASGMIGVLRWHAGFDATESGLLESIGLEVGAALENAQRYEAALEAADRDSVTGLLNHRAIHQRLDTEFERISGQDRPLSVIMMDLNNFKLFNDVYGHPVGDQVLKKVAAVLKEECRKFDILGRYGGDEFIAILPDTDTDVALMVAQHLHDRTMKQGFLPPGDNRTIPVTLSFGIAAFPSDSTNRHELLTIADANLYAAKQSEEGISRTSEAQRARRELHSEEGSFDILDAMVTAVDNKDRYTRHHSEDVTQYALWIVEELAFSEETMRVTRVGGLLHDVGKIGVPEDILRKPDRLTAPEYDAMKHHPQLGALIVGGVPGMESILDAVRFHHERWDGGGYPTGLSGEDIPLLGRILAVADAFSAMTTTRPYRQALTWEAALEEITTNAGTQFDPVMAEAFVAAAGKRRPAAE